MPKNLPGRRFWISLVLCLAGSPMVVAQVGDFNDDGSWDCEDIDALTEAAALGGDGSFDLTGDGLIDIRDVDHWRGVAGSINLDTGQPYLPGDGNLDGAVDGSDLMIWNSNKYTQVSSWCSGDFQADGLVDVADFNVWNANKFQRSGQPRDVRHEPSPLDGEVAFVYDASTGLMAMDPGDWEIFCWSVYGVAPLEFLLNGGSAEVDPAAVIWLQEHFAGHSKWFSLDNSPVLGRTVIARFEAGLTSDDFDYVSFGTPQGLMGVGEVTFATLSGPTAIPEPHGVLVLGIGIAAVVARRRRDSR